jgi:hypothetical protein
VLLADIPPRITVLKLSFIISVGSPIRKTS